MKIIACLLIFCLWTTLLQAQIKPPDTIQTGKNDTVKVAITDIDGEMLPWVLFPQVTILDNRIFKTAEERSKYLRLRYNVLKVLPYARFAGNRYRKLQRDLALTGDRRQQKVLVKACEKEIKDLFNKEIKNLSINQGEILIKLVDRETGNSSYDMLKDLKGNINAFMLQSVARIFSHDLKEKYDPEQERDIENIIRLSGYAYYYN
ncbi:MAG: DUF4294 domain-containing protein [Sphingobacteriaceae bacterium]